MSEHSHGGSWQDGVVMDEKFWDELYLEKEMWSGNPNPQLVAEVSDLKPGTALDVGCGEGADAIWLHERGWQVTAVDVSSVALDRARQRSSEVEWLHLNLAKQAAPGTYDLVTAHYVHFHPVSDMRVLQQRLVDAVAPGGTLLLVGHDQSEIDEADLDRPDNAELFYTAESTASLVPADDWVVEVAETRTLANPDHRKYDFVLKAQRRQAQWQ
nr:class I SAM-dependent methyltransferase [Kibdelosporangium sp. MJ126-NF4]CEL12734.1 Thioredoxin reductase [Kibdelosporangium sp. MJ126-NF4]CTQ93494.1 Thioredoxin reductase (EC 1.8.1.9) [Kibdelosporangium sp. MJ126-NF4]